MDTVSRLNNDTIIDLAEQIVTEVEKIDSLQNNSSKILNAKVVDSIKFEFNNADEKSYSYPVDGFVECTVASDQMEAYMSFYPPSQGMSPITQEIVAGELQRKGVIFGIDRKKIDDSVLQCNLAHNVLKNVRVASGIPQCPEIEKHVVLTDKITRKQVIEDDEAAQIDFRSVLNYIVVTKGEKIGTAVPARTGRDGMTVTGAKVPYCRETNPSVRIGKNLEERNDEVLALIDGIIEQTKSSISVKEVFVIEENVDYHMGNIEYSGDVIIRGSIQDGFSVKAGGNVYAEKTLDASNLECDGDLQVRQGIIGKKNGCIKAGGSVRANFVENCLIEAGGTIEITTGIIRSFMYTCGGIHGGPKSIVVGGTFFAQDGFRAYQIGSETSPKTEIYCGLDYSILKKLEWNKEQTLHLALGLRNLRKQIESCTSDVKRNELLITQQKIKDAIKKLNTISSNIVFNLDKNESATVEVPGQIYPGVYIEICHVPFVVKKPMINTRFFLDKSTGTIKTERIK